MMMISRKDRCYTIYIIIYYIIQTFDEVVIFVIITALNDMVIRDSSDSYPLLYDLMMAGRVRAHIENMEFPGTISFRSFSHLLRHK